MSWLRRYSYFLIRCFFDFLFTLFLWWFTQWKMLLRSSCCVVLESFADISPMSFVSMALILLASSILSLTRAKLVLHTIRKAFSDLAGSLICSPLGTRLWFLYLIRKVRRWLYLASFSCKYLTKIRDATQLEISRWRSILRDGSWYHRWWYSRSAFY